MTSAARSVYVFGIYLIVLGGRLIGSPMLVVFGLIDAAGAAWTLVALRSMSPALG